MGRFLNVAIPTLTPFARPAAKILPCANMPSMHSQTGTTKIYLSTKHFKRWFARRESDLVNDFLLNALVIYPMSSKRHAQISGYLKGIHLILYRLHSSYDVGGSFTSAAVSTVVESFCDAVYFFDNLLSTHICMLMPYEATMMQRPPAMYTRMTPEILLARSSRQT